MTWNSDRVIIGRAKDMASDSLTPQQRSVQMSLVKCRDTKPEMIVRKLVFAMGYRYRLHDRRLPGKPDLVFVGLRKIIFVNGCFFHRHSRCGLARLPKSNQDFWVPKLEGNKLRDRKNLRTLQRMGWKVLVVWECELKTESVVRSRLRSFLQGDIR